MDVSVSKTIELQEPRRSNGSGGTSAIPLGSQDGNTLGVVPKTFHVPLHEHISSGHQGGFLLNRFTSEVR
jgi:hypothetical protein